MDYFLGRNDEQMQCRGILHIVEAGDTLYKIGKKYGVAVSRIMYANPYVNVSRLVMRFVCLLWCRGCQWGKPVQMVL